MQDEKVFRIDDSYAFLTKELLEKEYVENKLSDKQIAQKYNIGSKVTIWRRRQFLGIQNSYKNKSNQNALKNRRFAVSKEDALRWQQEGKTYDKMAQLVGCSRMVLYRRIKELGIVTEYQEAMKHLRWHELLTDIQTKFLLGDLLGDGNILSYGMYQCNHSYKQKAYIEYKRDILYSLMSPNFNFKENVIQNYQNGKQYRAYYLRTMGNEHVKKIYDQFYVDKIKIFPYDYLMGSCFDAYSLAIWYMDDGGRKGNTPSLYTFGFGYNGNLEVLKFLKNRFDTEAIIKIDDRSQRSEDKRHYISFSGAQANKFFQLVAPYVLPLFQYKLPEKYRSQISLSL